MYALFGASVLLISPLSLTPLTSTLPASSILKNFKQRSYSVRMASNNFGSVAAPTSSNAIFLMWNESRIEQKLHNRIYFYKYS